MVSLVMAATKTTPVARRVRTASVIEERFESQGRAWLWREGATVVGERYRSVSESQRDELRALFLRKLVPQAEKRGIAADPCAAQAPSGVASADVRWVRWFREGEDPAPLWALFAQSRVLSSTDADNDTWNLVAWGDGPALAWASNDPIAQSCLRAALRAMPAWLSGGVLSRDPSFAVRIERASDASRTRRASTTRREASDGTSSESNESNETHAARATSGESATRPNPRAILAAWRKTHPARSA